MFLNTIVGLLDRLNLGIRWSKMVVTAAKNQALPVGGVQIAKGLCDHPNQYGNGVASALSDSHAMQPARTP